MYNCGTIVRRIIDHMIHRGQLAGAGPWGSRRSTIHATMARTGQQPKEEPEEPEVEETLDRGQIEPAIVLLRFDSTGSPTRCLRPLHPFWKRIATSVGDQQVGRLLVAEVEGHTEPRLAPVPTRLPGSTPAKRADRCPAAWQTPAERRGHGAAAPMDSNSPVARRGREKTETLHGGDLTHCLVVLKVPVICYL